MRNESGIIFYINAESANIIFLATEHAKFTLSEVEDVFSVEIFPGFTEYNTITARRPFEIVFVKTYETLYRGQNIFNKSIPSCWPDIS